MAKAAFWHNIDAEFKHNDKEGPEDSISPLQVVLSTKFSFSSTSFLQHNLSQSSQVAVLPSLHFLYSRLANRLPLHPHRR